MITLLSGFPGNVVAVACSGLVTGQDYETILIPTVEKTLEDWKMLRLYYQIEPDFKGIEPAAIWDDFKVGMEHLSRWERIAVVADVEWIRLAVRAFSFLMPGKVRVFAVDDAPQARSWILGG